MNRSASVVGAAGVMIVATALVVGCQKQSSRTPNEVGTATITSVGVDSPAPDSTTVRVQAPDGRTVRSVHRLATAQDLGDEDDTVQLARAMCERKLVCGDVGPGAQFRTLDGCLAEARSHATARLADDACLPDRTMLATCLASVRAERCDRDLDVTTRVHACKAAELCAH